MKTIIYGMQSSGASLFCYWLSQQDNCIGITDLYYDQVSPDINHENVVLKCVVTKNISFDRHIESFKPDRKILFIRNPIENYLSLSEKIYSDFGGSIDDKFKILEKHLDTKNFDYIIKYEDFIMKKTELGDNSYYNFKKTTTEVVQYNNLNNNWCQTNYKKKWGIGNIHANRLNIINYFYPNLNSYY